MGHPRGLGRVDRARRCLIAFSAVTASWTPLAATQALSQSASGDHAMVVSAQRLATEAGVKILHAGGNAIDAAVAVGYALAVVYPAAGNIGGGGFMTIRFHDGRATFLDFREKAPLAATETMFQDAHGALIPNRSTDSWLAVGVPSTVAGLETALKTYGTLPRAQVIAPAIALARDGFVLTEADIDPFREDAEGLAKDPGARALFTHDGAPLQAGDRLVQPDLARSLDLISRTGVESLITGPLGQAIAAASDAGHGIITTGDFAHYRVRELPPVHCEYRGFTVLSAPPPSSGGTTVCEILNILEGYDLRGMGFHSAPEVHVLVEAMRRGYRDRNTALGDPDFVENPVSHLIDKTYAASLRASIEADRATPSATLGQAPPVKEGQQTTHYSVVDAEGNAVSVTYTLNGWFGAMRVAGDTGILMNNEMDDFTARPGSPNMFGLIQGKANAVAPGKTPLSSMSPTILTKDGKLVMVTGSPGGSRIISITVEMIVDVVDHGMSIQEAVDAPRIHEQFQPETVDLEPDALTPVVRKTLESEGYAFRDRPAWGHAESLLAGGSRLDASGNVVAETGMDAGALFGANDPRAPAGAALGY